MGIAKGSIVRMKGVTRFERCSCWPEMIDRGALLAGTDLPLPVALPPPSLKQAPDNWKHLDIFFFFFCETMVIFISYIWNFIDFAG